MDICMASVSQKYACPNHDHSHACWDLHFYWKCLWTWASSATPNQVSPLWPRTSAVLLSFPFLAESPCQLSWGMGGEEEAALRKNDTDSHCFYPTFSLWNINTSQMVFDKFPECWKVVLLLLPNFVVAFLKRELVIFSLCSSHASLPGCEFFWCDQLFLGCGVCGELEFPPLLTQELHPDPLWICLWILHVRHHAWCTAGAQQMLVALVIWKMADRWHGPFKHWMWTHADLALGLK